MQNHMGVNTSLQSDGGGAGGHGTECKQEGSGALALQSVSFGPFAQPPLFPKFSSVTTGYASY